MAHTSLRSYEQEYAERFEWRRLRQIANLKELSEIAQPGGAKALQAFPGLRGTLRTQDFRDALRQSILQLWCEAAECFILGEFQSCILTCGAIVERCLKLEYKKAGRSIVGKEWTLRTCIQKCKEAVSPDVIALAKQILKPRNSRAHANLEHSDPVLALLGSDRGDQTLRSGHRLVEPYRGDALNVIVITCKILKELYGVDRAGFQESAWRSL